MKEVEVTLQKEQGPVAVKCFETSIPGLVINRGDYPIGEEVPDWGLWSVSHRPSGYAVVRGLPNREIAVLAASWLGSYGYDWSQLDPEAIYRDERIRSQIKELIEAARAVQYAIEDLADLLEANPGLEREIDEGDWNVLARFPLRGSEN